MTREVSFSPSGRSATLPEGFVATLYDVGDGTSFWAIQKPGEPAFPLADEGGRDFGSVEAARHALVAWVGRKLRKLRKLRTETVG